MVIAETDRLLLRHFHVVDLQVMSRVFGRVLAKPVVPLTIV
jgi:hypothetical protein